MFATITCPIHDCENQCLEITKTDDYDVAFIERHFNLSEHQIDKKVINDIKTIMSSDLLLIFAQDEHKDCCKRILNAINEFIERRLFNSNTLFSSFSELTDKCLPIVKHDYLPGILRVVYGFTVFLLAVDVLNKNWIEADDILALVKLANGMSDYDLSLVTLMIKNLTSITSM